MKTVVGTKKGNVFLKQTQCCTSVQKSVFLLVKSDSDVVRSTAHMPIKFDRDHHSVNGNLRFTRQVRAPNRTDMQCVTFTSQRDNSTSTVIQ